MIMFVMVKISTRVEWLLFLGYNHDRDMRYADGRADGQSATCIIQPVVEREKGDDFIPIKAA